ncbi:RNA-splicing factor [Allomyces javanicus]|nr:RNA-splicing factor [Allomyces javanicus]
MYNGIGLTTPRGSGTNGYVTRNLSSLRARDPRMGDRGADFNNDQFLKPRQPNKEILLHEQKRQVEVKCLELRLKLEDEGVDEDSIDDQVDALRKKLLAELAGPTAADAPSTSTHQQAARKAEEAQRFASALGIRDDVHRPGEAFNRELQEQKRQEKIAEREKRAAEFAEKEAREERRRALAVLAVVAEDVAAGRRTKDDLKATERELGMRWDKVKDEAKAALSSVMGPPRGLPPRAAAPRRRDDANSYRPGDRRSRSRSHSRSPHDSRSRRRPEPAWPRPLCVVLALAFAVPLQIVLSLSVAATAPRPQHHWLALAQPTYAPWPVAVPLARPQPQPQHLAWTLAQSAQALAESPWYEGWLWISPNCRWASQTCRGHQVPCKLVMHDDGNLALYQHDTTPTWSTGTGGTRAARLSVLDDGHVKLTDADCQTTFWSNQPNRIEFAGEHHGYQAKIDSIVVPLFVRAMKLMQQLQSEMLKCKQGPEMVQLLDTLLPVVALFLTTAKDKTRSLIQHAQEQFYYTDHTRWEQESAQMALSHSQTSRAKRLANALDAQIKLLEGHVKEAQTKKAQVELDMKCAGAENIDHVNPQQCVGMPGMWPDAVKSTAMPRERCGTYPEVRIRGIRCEKEIILVERAWLMEHLDPILNNNALDQGAKPVFKHHFKGYVTFEPMVRALDGVIQHLVATKMVPPGDKAEKLLADVKAITNGTEECRKSAARFGIVV